MKKTKEENIFVKTCDYRLYVPQINSAGAYYIGDNVYSFALYLRQKPFFIHRLMMRLFFGIKWRDMES
jgi:hypothetical protein